MPLIPDKARLLIRSKRAPKNYLNPALEQAAGLSHSRRGIGVGFSIWQARRASNSASNRIVPFPLVDIDMLVAQTSIASSNFGGWKDSASLQRRAKSDRCCS